MKKYNISIKLHNGKDITSGNYDGSMTIAQLYNQIKFHFDFFDEKQLEIQWIAFSTSTDTYIDYSFNTLDQLLPGIESDIFILQPQGTHGLQLYQWYTTSEQNFKIQQNQQQQKMNDIQLQQLNNLLLEACVTFVEEQYEKSIEQYLDVLELDEWNLEAVLGLGKCLHALNCPKSAISVYELIIKQNPANNYAIFLKAKSLNEMNLPQSALTLLQSCKHSKISNQSYYKQELNKTKQLMLPKNKK